MDARVRKALDAFERPGLLVPCLMLLAPPIFLGLVLEALAPDTPDELGHWLDGAPIIATAFGASLVAVSLFLRDEEGSEARSLFLLTREAEELAPPSPADAGAVAAHDAAVTTLVARIEGSKWDYQQRRDFTRGCELSGAALLAIGGVMGIVAWAM